MNYTYYIKHTLCGRMGDSGIRRYANGGGGCGACRTIKINGMEKHFGRAGFLAINKRGEHLHSPLHTSSVGDRGYGDVKVVKVG